MLTVCMWYDTLTLWRGRDLWHILLITSYRTVSTLFS